MPTTTHNFSPETFQGNWQRRQCFVWFERPDDAEEFGLWILSHRDSGLVDRSNGAIIRKRLAKFEVSGDVIFFGCSHWAVGHTDEMAVRVYQPGTTQTTAAFDELAEIEDATEAYPILDESDYSDREYESALEGIDCMMLGDVPKDVPDDWKEQVYGWLSNNEPNELENTDDRGAFPDSAAIKRALLDLGLIEPEAA
jgi:hypothetical protein